MNALMEKYANLKGNCKFTVLAFPCNQFGFQEPAADETELRNGLKFCRPGSGYEPNFPLMKKLDANGESEEDLYTFFKRRCPPTEPIINDRDKITWSPVRHNDISWNFEKFLIDHHGQPRLRYSPPVTPFKIKGDIEALLDKCEQADYLAAASKILSTGPSGIQGEVLRKHTHEKGQKIRKHKKGVQ